MCPIKLKIGILYHVNNTFQNTTFLISVDVPLTFKRFFKNNCLKSTMSAQGFFVKKWCGGRRYHIFINGPHKNPVHNMLPKTIFFFLFLTKILAALLSREVAMIRTMACIIFCYLIQRI